MPRRRRVPKRPLLPDPKFKSTLVTRFVNNLMKDGKKSTAESIFYDAIDDYGHDYDYDYYDYCCSSKLVSNCQGSPKKCADEPCRNSYFQTGDDSSKTADHSPRAGNNLYHRLDGGVVEPVTVLCWQTEFKRKVYLNCSSFGVQI